MPIIKKPFTLAPLNDNPVNIANVVAGGTNKITGGFSHKNGFPTIKFSVPPQPAMLETGTLRLVGQLLVKDANDNMLKTDAVNTATVGSVATTPVGFSDGANAAKPGKINKNNAADAGGLNLETNVNMPNWGGVKNVIEKVVVQSKKTLVEISTVNNYSQYTALQECYTNNEVDYKQSPYCRALTTGKNAGNTNRRVVGSVAYDSASGTAGGADTNSLGGMASLSSANDEMIGQFFSINLNVDLLNVDMLNIDDNFLGGLLITLHLNPDSSMFHSRYRQVKGSAVVSSPVNNFSYTLKNVKLEGRYVIPTAQEAQAYPQALMLGSRLNLINDIHSSVNSNSYTPQLQMVKSMVNVFLDNDQTNNFNKNANNFRKPVGEKSNISAKNGLKFPVNYEVKNVPNFDKPLDNAGSVVAPSSLEKKSLMFGDAETRKYFDKALMDGKEPYHSSADFDLEDKSLVSDYKADADATDKGFGLNVQPNCVGIGTDFTLGLGMIQNFVNQDYNFTLKSGVNTGNGELPASRNGATTVNPLLQQTFVRHQSQFDSVNLVKVV